MRSSILGTWIATGVLWFASPAAALEMISNGKFDASLAGWGGCCAGSGSSSFDAAHDAHGSGLSGSAQLVHVDPPDQNGPSFLFISQCLSGPALQPGKGYFFGVGFRFREGEVSEGEVFLGAEFRATTDCTGANLSGAGSAVELATDGRGSWRTLAIGSKASGVVAPAGVKSVRVAVVLSMTAGTKLTLNADDVFAAPVGTPVCDGLPATFLGTTLPDVILGTSASDVIVGLGGADQIDGKGGNDRICGGAGADTVYGGVGDDRLFGGAGSDHLFGGPDHDMLRGGVAGDYLYGEAGVDSLKGGGGTDACDGGPDAVDLASGCESTTAVP